MTAYRRQNGKRNTNATRDRKSGEKRAFVWRRDHGVCHLCDCPIEQGFAGAWELDHVEAREAAKIDGRKADNSVRNLAVSHSTKAPCERHGGCNQRRGSRPRDYARSLILGNPVNGSESDAPPVKSEVATPALCQHGKPPHVYCVDCRMPGF